MRNPDDAIDPADFAEDSALERAARDAQARKNFDRALGLWRALIARSPELEDAWLSAGVSLRELKRFAEVEELLARAQGRFPRNGRIASTRAWNVMTLADWPAAERLWREFREHFPDDSGGYIGLCFILRRANRVDEFERLAAEAIVRFPDNREFELLHASVPAMRRQWPESAERHGLLRTKYPDESRIVVPLADALKHQSRFDEAEAVLVEGCRAFPNASAIHVSFAQLASHRRLWTEAVSRWEDVRARFPDLTAAYTGLSGALRGANLTERQAQLLQDAAARFPNDEPIALEQVTALIERRDWSAAGTQLETLAKRFPNSPKVLSEYGFALLSGGKCDQAERVLSDALKRFPDHWALRLNQARAAGARSDWSEAVNRWSALQKLNPHDQLVKTELGQARYNLELMDPQEQSTSGAPVPPTPPSQAAATGNAAERDIAMVCRFESLGEDCEFGLFQREIGAEPLGLLRFAGTSPKNLVTALNSRFDGVGTPEFMELEIRSDEYVATDRRFGMRMHTHINPQAADFEATRQMMLRKTQFLKRKLLEDLEIGEKIFVYKDTLGNVSASLMELRAALDAYGTPRLFVIKIAGPGKPHGHLEVVDSRTVIGYIDRHGYAAFRWNIPIASWLALCRKACEHWSVAY